MILTKKTYRHVTTVEELHAAVDRIKFYKTQFPDMLLAVDCETYALLDDEDWIPYPIKDEFGMYRGFIKTIQIGLDPAMQDEQFIIDVEKIANNQVVGDLLRPVLESSTILGQNLAYDWIFLFVHLNISLKSMRDCMLIGQVQFAGDKVSHNLANAYQRYIPEVDFYSYTGMTFEEYAVFKSQEQKSGWRGELNEKQLQYAADDVRLIFFLFEKILVTLDKFIDKYETRNQTNQTIFNPILLECSLIPIYAMMKWRGAGYDIEYHQKTVIPFLNDRVLEAEAEVGKYFTTQVKKNNGLRGKKREVWFETECINIRSVPQLKEALASVGVEVDDTGEKTLEKVKSKHPAIPAILKFKKASSLLSKFGQKMLDAAGPTGVIHANWFQIGADDASVDTGRSSCQNPNLMQIPNREDSQVISWGTSLAKLFRRSFIAKPGNKIIDADLVQIEPCIQSEICDELEQIAAFIEAARTGVSVDTHALTAKAAFGLDFLPSNVEINRLKEEGNHELAAKYKKLRASGKILNLGIGYGMGARKLAAQITEQTGEECSEDKAKLIIKTYYNNLPGIWAMKKKVEAEVRHLAEAHQSLAPFANRKPIAVMFTVLGRPRRWCLKKNPVDQEALAVTRPEVLGKWYAGGRNEYNSRLSEVAREAYNFIIQGTCADILKQALVLIQDRFDAAGFDRLSEGIIMVVHDEIVSEVKEEHAELAKTIIEDSMLEAARNVLKRVPPQVEINIADNWADAH